MTAHNAAADGRDSAPTPVAGSDAVSRENPAATSDEVVQSPAVEPVPAVTPRVTAEPDRTPEVANIPAVAQTRVIDPDNAAQGKAEALTDKPVEGHGDAVEVDAVDAQSAPAIIPAGSASPEVPALSSDPQPSADTPSLSASSDASLDDVLAVPESEPDSNSAMLAAAAQELIDRAAGERVENRAENRREPPRSRPRTSCAAS